MTAIKYVGAKPSKADNVAGTKFVWLPGQVHDVSDAAACRKLLAHPDIWAIDNAEANLRAAEQAQREAEEAVHAAAAAATAARAALAEAEERAKAEAEAQAAKAAAGKTPDEMNLEELRAALEAKGIKPHHKAGEDKLRAALAEVA